MSRHQRRALTNQFVLILTAVSELPLPAAAKKSVAAKGINEFRNLVFLARNVARYSSQLGVGQSCWCVCIPVYVLCLCVSLGVCIACWRGF